MKKWIAVVGFITAGGSYAYSQVKNVETIFNDAAKQTELMLQSVAVAKGNDTNLVAPRTIENGKLKLIPSRDWTSGFFAGELWMLYEVTRNEKWRLLADSFSLALEKEKFNRGTHDMGFKMYPSFGAGYRLTKNERYKEVLIQSAKTLITRFNKTAGVIRSWDHNRDKWDYPVIIDNMMNLELLFAATRFTGDSIYYQVAVSHANTTLKNHFRNDYSSYHVIEYDTSNGAVKKRNTHQGYADESAWARGQAWALYGFTMCYRETKNKAYLEQAENVAAFLMKHPALPNDAVPYWDFNDPSIPNAPRDASAGAIIASGLYELSSFSKEGQQYKAFADRIMNNLVAGYRSKPGENFGFVLLHSTGHKPHNSEIDVPINYADYYFLEALMRSKKPI